MEQRPILRVAHVVKQFANFRAVADVSFDLGSGEVLGLLGPSGCGKTTLLRLIAGFEQPDAGEIELVGRIVADRKTWVPPERRAVGMVFQDFALFPHLTVHNNIAFGLKPSSQRDRAVSQQVAEALSLVGLQGKGDRYPHELSGGQQQRVALARALAPRPSLLLLDEPLSNLDVQVRQYLRQEVRDILKATNTAAVFVTHDQEEALSIADRVAVMQQGQIEQIGTPEQIYCEPASRFVASFVAQANFLPAQPQGQVWQTEIGDFPAHSVTHLPETGELMIRPEELLLEPDEAGAAIVRDRQFLGREYRYCLRTASGRDLHARTATTTRIPVNSKVRLTVAVKPSPVSR